MSGLTNALVAQQVQALLDTQKRQTDYLTAWLGGSPTGGPNNDGRYPFVDLAGVEILVPAPATFNSMVSGPAALSVAAKAAAEFARDLALGHADRANDQRELAEAARGAAVDARNLAQEHRNHAGTHEANARYWAELAQGVGQTSTEDREIVEQLAEQVADNAALASQDADDAAASAALAATFDPALYDLKSETLAASRLTGIIDRARIPVLPSGRQFASTGGLPQLTSAQQAEIGEGSIVTTTDGMRYVYSGQGSKTVAASYTVLADITPDWDALANKPSFYPSNITNVAGLQSALDGKAPAAHTHTIADVIGLTVALDSKINATGATRLTIANAEAIRLTAASSYFSWFDDAQTTRRGYLQLGGNFVINNEQANGSINLIPGSGGRVEVLGAGGLLVSSSGGLTVAGSGGITASKLTANGNIQTNAGGFVSAQPTGNVHLRMKDANNASGRAALLYKDTANLYVLLTDDGAADGGFNALRPFRIGLDSGYVAMSNGVEIRSGLTVYDGLSMTGNLTGAAVLGTASGDGNGIRFWGANAAYSIYMSGATQASWGGRVAGETTSDYNMYFRMQGGANRGFVFLNDRTPIAGIDATGNGRFQHLESASEVYTGNWFRVRGPSSGIYWEQFGGGWQMIDSTWMRSYGNKYIYTTGIIQGGQLIGTSDARKKTKIVPVTTKDACALVDAIVPKDFDWIETGRSSRGFIAQDLEKHDPRFVSEDPDGFLGLEPMALISTLWAALRQTRAEVASLTVGRV